MHSCIYEGIVTHRRRRPVDHRFQYRLFMVWLDLDEMPMLVGRRGMIGSSQHATRSFLRRDHLFDATRPLDEEVREVIRRQTSEEARGPIRLLTQLRYFGFYFSPLNLFYVYDRHDREIEYVVAEVSNTPWNERHCYVLWHGNRHADVESRSKSGAVQRLSFSHAKDFHVSPFMGMRQSYRWHLTEPGTELSARLANVEEGKVVFDAALSLQRREMCRRQLRLMSLRYPLMTARISAAIYLQALKLWWKKCPFYKHPPKQNRLTPTS